MSVGHARRHTHNRSTAGIRSDNFNRANGALGAGWSNLTAGGMAIVSNQIKAPSNGAVLGNLRTESYNADQFSEATLTSSTLNVGDFIGLVVRGTSGGANCYFGFYFNLGGTLLLTIYKGVGGSNSQVGVQASLPSPLPVGTKLRLGVIGSQVILRANGQAFASANDPSPLSGGAPGVCAFNTTASLDNWHGGNMSARLPVSFDLDYLDGDGATNYDILVAGNAPSGTAGGPGGTHTLRVVKPTSPAAVPHCFLWALPVVAEQSADTTGNPVAALVAAGAHNQLNATIIVPSFGQLSYCADHATDRTIQYEAFVAKQLIPWAMANLATTGTEKHLLIGFSKSGFASMGLLLKYPQLFAKAACWDWPADMPNYNTYDGAVNYGTDANFQANYRLTSAYMDAHKAPVQGSNRIWIGGYSAFQTDVADFDALLTAKAIPHTTETPTSRTHAWNSGWVPDALAALAS